MAVEPKTQAFLDQLAAAGGPPIYTLAPQAARDVLLQVQAGNVPKAPAEIEDATFPVGPTGTVPVRILRPSGQMGRLPVVLYFHGGGWILGDREVHDRLARDLVSGANVTLVFVDYARAPEARYPVAIEQGHAVARYVADNADRLRIDPQRMAVAGDSAGATLATVVAMLAKQRNGPTIAYQALFYPVTDANLDTGSYRQFAEGYWLTRESMRWFWDAYVPDAARRRDPTVSPLQASRQDLAGMPPTLILTAEDDVLRDEGEAYAERLAAAGVPVVSVRYNGAIHDFLLLNPLRDTAPTRGALEQVCAALRGALHVRTPIAAGARELAPSK
ncbi:MAG: alpha/beta hydrolase [Pseudomonadota bacterium]|nr:alpha/beta hydrolase [Pseudomonadota bacterium]